jgi:hypothetical protein
MRIAKVTPDEFLVDVLFPGSAKLLATGQLIMPPGGLAEADVATQEACGYFVITETPPPTVTETQRYEYTIELVDGRPVQVWTVREESTDERTERLRAMARVTLRDIQRAQTFISRSDTFQALSAPTLAQTRDHLKMVSTAVEELLAVVIGGALLDQM